MASQQLRLPDRLGQAGRDAQLRDSARASGWPAGRQHQQRVARRAAASALDRSRELERRPCRACARRGAPPRNGSRRAARASGRERLGRRPRQSAACPSWRSSSLEDARGWCALSSTTSTAQRRAGSAGAPAGRGVAARLRRQPGGEAEGAALRRRRSRPRSAAHQLDQLRARWSGPARCRRTCAWSSGRPA